jgi:hypothetical protein
MTYGDLYDAIPLWWGIVGGIIGVVILVALVIWRRNHPL